MIALISSAEFLKALKKLAKKQRSILDDIEKLKASLMENPLQGTDIGFGCRKVRMAISSKNKGKSGGARVITYVEAVTAELDGTLVLLYIYDKSDRESISDSELLAIIKAFGA